MDTTESVADILRPLAEAMVRAWEAPGPPPWGGTFFAEALDPRFDALREGEWGVREGQAVSFVTGDIDASLGAIVRAAAACGLDVVELYQWPGGKWGCTLRHYLSTLPTDPQRPHGGGATPEEAAARALVKAWGDEKQASQIGEKA